MAIIKTEQYPASRSAVGYLSHGFDVNKMFVAPLGRVTEGRDGTAKVNQ